MWFCQSVMPLLRHVRKVRLSIAGSRPPEEVLALQQGDIDVLGFVNDEHLHNLYHEAHLAIAPLRYGAGVKGKVIEAMALGLPVVTTSVGAQGIEGAAGLLFLGDHPETLAEQVLLAAEVARGRERALAALDFIELNYSTQAMSSVLELGFSLDRTFD
jgi:glycosyltransferase involved in cell wall biosynthesis